MKKEKWFWLMLLLLTGGLLMSGCDDVDDETGDKGSVLTGTATKEWTKYTMTFTDSTDAAVWMQVEIRTSSAFR